jgi:hypothetical protein
MDSMEHHPSLLDSTEHCHLSHPKEKISNLLFHAVGWTSGK